MARPRTPSKSGALARGYRSGLEKTVGAQLEVAGIKAEYESGKLAYRKPESQHKYTWDFRLPNGIIIETKGRFLAADRAKHLLLKEQHPEVDIRFVFSNSREKIYKGSPTSYADWCRKNGFRFADKLVPTEWLK